jgi:subtilisin family serine protease
MLNKTLNAIPVVWHFLFSSINDSSKKLSLPHINKFIHFKIRLMNHNSFLTFGAIIAFNVISSIAIGQDSKNTDNSATANKYYNWYNLDPKKNKIVGIGTERAYDELLKGKPMKTVIVAVIDGGVDIHQEDLQGKIWVNKSEIPGNGIDDDHNGYVDDVNGWDFIGGANGQDINQETLELTRLYKKLSSKFAGVDTLKLSGNDLQEFMEFKKVRSKYIDKTNKTIQDYQNFLSFTKAFIFSDSMACVLLHKTNYTLADIKSIKPGDNEQITAIKEFLMSILKKASGAKEIRDYLDDSSTREYIDNLTNKMKYNYNLNFNPRTIVGDDPEVWGSSYGNNDVIGPRAGHGTFVSGIIAANRHNNLGILGIADSVKIMVVRTVPDGDERDKDVANAIIYAVNNGAQILNLSFGKDYSPQKKFVDNALKYAATKDVLIVHAAGNDAEDIDTMPNFPTNKGTSGSILMDNWLTVGASSQKANKELPGSFSNYGKKEVDLFAPGVNIFGLKPDNKYEDGDGTSFAAPMVAGAAALIKSVYPSLHASQIKEILLRSSTKYPRLKVYLPSEDSSQKKKKVKFGTLSKSGGVLDVYQALKLAEQYVKNAGN